MAIQSPAPPEEGQKILDCYLPVTFSRDTPENREVLQGIDVSHIRASQAHQSYFVELGEVARGHILPAAELTLWRYIVRVDSRVIADANLYIDRKGDLHFAAVGYGPIANATVRAVEWLRTHPLVKAKEYELRSLEIPALHYVAIWLRGATDSLIIAIEPTPRRLRSFGELTLLTERELTGLLQPAAAEAMRRYELAPDGSGG